MATGKRIVTDTRQYCIHDLIAKGAFSEVYRCTAVATGMGYAVKIIDRQLAVRQRMEEALIREVDAMESAGSSPYVASLVDKLVSTHNYYLIMNVAEGGTLLDLIRERALASFLRQHTAMYMRQLLTGLAALHARNLVHRDIKPENILLNKDRTEVMISDFGFACYAKPGALLHRTCGTLKYCAPELLCESPSYDGRKVDIWAAGVTLYVILFRTHPYKAEAGDADALLACIQRKPYTLPHSVAPDVRDMLSRMLHVDPQQRWSAEQLLQHPWMQSVAKDGAESHPANGDGETATELCGQSVCVEEQVGRDEAWSSASRRAGRVSEGSPRSVEFSQLYSDFVEYVDDGVYMTTTSDFPEEIAPRDKDGVSVCFSCPSGTPGVAPPALPFADGLCGIGSPLAASLYASSATAAADAESHDDHTHNSAAAVEDEDEEEYEGGGTGMINVLGLCCTAFYVARLIGYLLLFWLPLLVVAVLRLVFGIRVTQLRLPLVVRRVLLGLAVPPQVRMWYRRRGGAKKARDGDRCRTTAPQRRVQAGWTTRKLAASRETSGGTITARRPSPGLTEDDTDKVTSVAPPVHVAEPTSAIGQTTASEVRVRRARAVAQTCS